MPLPILPLRTLPRAAERDVFPLPLETFERYMVTDDRPEYPMAFAIAIDLSGDLQREAFGSALSSALGRHPLLSCLVRRLPFRGPCWVWDTGLVPSCEWREDDAPLSLPGGPRIDLSREPGLRVWARVRPGRARVTFQFHHAATDGLGGMQFIGDLLAHYGRETTAPGQEAPELDPVDPRLLRFRAGGSQAPRWTESFRCAVREYLQLLRRIPAPVSAPSAASSTDAIHLPFPAFLTRTFSREVYGRIKELAARTSVTPNDLFLWTMFRTLRQWNRQEGTGGEPDLLRIGIPTTLRTPDLDQMPAANVLSYLFVDQRAAAADQETALQRIHRRTESVMNRAEAEAFVTGMRIGFHIPGVVPAVLKLNPCFASVILANVGDVKRQFRARFPLRQGRIVAGNIQLEALVGAAPIRRNTRVAVSLGVYAGTLYVNMHCDPRFFDLAQAERLADLFADQIRATAVGAGSLSRSVIPDAA